MVPNAFHPAFPHFSAQFGSLPGPFCSIHSIWVLDCLIWHLYQQGPDGKSVPALHISGRAGCKDSERTGEYREKGRPRQQDARGFTAAGCLDSLPFAIYRPAHHPPDAAKSKRRCRLVSSPALESPVADSHQEQLAG